MKTWCLEKRVQYNDGSMTPWEIAKYGGTPEVWHDYEKARQSAERRNDECLDGAEWRVEGDEHW